MTIYPKDIVPEINGVMAATSDIHGLRTMMVNVYFVGPTSTGAWVLVDAGMPGYRHRIMDTAERLFGEGKPPSAIILTHGHFDHIGSLEAILKEWKVPVYAHPLELPYLTGQEDYPPPDPTVGGGLLARLSPLFPKKAANFSEDIQALPEDGSVPVLSGWRWVHTPGHSRGHVSFFRDDDRALIAGDAFVTVRQESAWAVMTQHFEVRRPPAYFTPDWTSAHRSIRLLRSLAPQVAATGHGRPVRGATLTEGLSALDRDFDEIALPKHGRYVPDAT